MAQFFPFRSDVESSSDGEPRILEIDENAAEEVFSALSSQTTRTILTSLYDSPNTAGKLAEITDTTPQNVHYHLEKLLNADLIHVADTWYSEKGREMKVYAPTDSSVVLFTSSEADKSTVYRLFERLIGSVGLVMISGIITRICFAVYNGLARIGYSRNDEVETNPTPSTPPDLGTTVLSPEFLVLWILIAIGFGLLWRRWS